jgi:flagellar motor switch protein FliG
MAKAQDPASAAMPPVAQMTKPQKLAALLVLLGPASAATLLKQFEEGELETVTAEMAKIRLLDQEMQRELLREFSEVAVHASTSIRGGFDFANDTLQLALGQFRASDLLSRVMPSRTPVAAMQTIIDMDARQIFNLIRHEQVQTIALVLSYLPPEKSSQLLQLLRSEVRDQVIERLATLSPTPIEVLEKVVEVLNQKMGSRPTRALNQSGGLKTAAALLNAMDKNLSKSLLVALEERNPELGQAIRQKMFTFEDLTNLDPNALQKILREVDLRDLAVALKTASEKLKGALLGSISKRAAETVREEISFMGPLKLKEIDAAQLRIIEVVRRLESEGEIDLGETQEETNAALV